MHTDKKPPTTKLILWALRAAGPCSAEVVEAILWNWQRVPDSTVRGCLVRLRRRGLLESAGTNRKGARRWRLAEDRKASKPQPTNPRRF